MSEKQHASWFVRTTKKLHGLFQQDAQHELFLLIYKMLKANFQHIAQDNARICPGLCKEAMLSMLPFRMVRFENNLITTSVETWIPHNKMVLLLILLTLLSSCASSPNASHPQNIPNTIKDVCSAGKHIQVNQLETQTHRSAEISAEVYLYLLKPQKSQFRYRHNASDRTVKTQGGRKLLINSFTQT